ncbi:RING-H2 finger protein ATL1-like [Chenopodium quinoa]|uniref:RING-H2 finger protein ATL1-like n=1 Tax=Chenopodium quinoa TaxID=63459 RepID=UPI000B79974E|nr:RING-H2 finger protein ATL1-like [Chenopodium quinoa]
MDISPPPPPPPPLPLSPSPPILHLQHPENNSFPVIAIAVIGILATALLLISYYIFVIKCCLTWHRVDFFNRFFSRVRDPSNDTGSLMSPTLSPDGNTAVPKGLDEALIRSIPVIEFRKLITERKQHDIITSEPAASYECAVCLSEFEEGERLRVIPYCCHAFHIDCIDVWLQSNANCPLCRSGISPASILYNTQQHFTHYPPPFQPQKPSNDDDDDNDNDNDNDTDNDDDDFVVIEIQGNNLDEPRLVTRGESEEKRRGRKKLGHVYSLGDELIDMRKQDEEFEVVQPIRRSISMDLSKDREYCFEIREYCSSDIEVCEVSSSSSNNKVRRSIFSFGYGRSSSSRCSVQPVHLDP